MRTDRKTSLKADKKAAARSHKRGAVGYNKKTALLEDAITQMNAGKYGRSSAALKELLALDPHNMEARRLFATLHLRLGSLIPARQAFDSLINEAFERQDYWLAESLLREYLAAGPRCVPYLEKLGSVFEQKGNASEAVAEYGKAVEILIEDPDPENPDHASQLYAKIRELAPANPVAFRLASCFDAETGELVARPPASHSEAASVTPSSATVEGTLSAPAIAESTTGLMPWEQVEDDASGAIPPASVPEPSRFGQLPVAQDVPTAPSQEAGVVDTSEGVESSAGKGRESTLDVQPDQSERTSSRPPVTQSYDGASSGIQPGTEPVDGPMPWEDILESIITIPDQLSDSPSHPAVQAEAPSAAVLGEPESTGLSQDASGEAARSGPVVDDPVPIGLATDESSVTPPEPFPAAGPEKMPTETAKPGKFSWQSVFSAAWKFGEKPASSEPQSEAVEADQPHLEEPSNSSLSSLRSEPSETESVEIPEPVRGNESADSADTSVVTPMPWDQVQDSTVTIQPAEDQETIADLAIEPSVESASPVVPDLALSRELSPEQVPSASSVTSTGVAPESGKLSFSQTPPDLPTRESEFRFASSAPAHSMQEELVFYTETASAASALPEVNEAESLMLGESEAPIVTDAPAAPASIEPSTPEPAPVAITTPIESQPASALKAEGLPEEGQAGNMLSPTTETGAEHPPAPRAIVAEPSPDPSAFTALEVNRGRMSADSAHSRTGDAKVEGRRPASKKRRGSQAPESEITLSPFSHEGAPSHQAEGSQQQETPLVEAKIPLPAEPAPQKEEPRKEEWVRTGETIRFVDEPKVSTGMETALQAPKEATAGATQPMSTAAAAVEVLFDSSTGKARRGTGEQAAQTKSRRKRRSRLSRIGTGFSAFVASCFSTTRSIVMSLVALVVLSAALLALTIGGVGLTWVIMEKAPTPAFQNLTASPQRTLSDAKKNGYLLLLGFDAPSDQDPIQAGSERQPDQKDADMALACLGAGGGGPQGGRSNASASVASEWFRGSNPVGRFKVHQDAIKGWVNKAESALGRYKQWQRLSFEDWGYGRTISPPCTSILFSHHLYLADGFVQGADIGVDRLETDMEAWRIALGQAKTLPVKTLAIQAINDDVAVASGLLVQPDFDGKYLGRLIKLLRPLDQVELSIRWPMQSELVSASKTFEAKVKAERAEERTITAVVASALPLPKQRRFNAYAEYYEASYKAAGEGRHGSLPKWKNYIQFPPSTVMDYVINPIENVVGLEPLAPWDLYDGLVVDTDARLRLASLQAWLRRGPQDADLLARIAKAGQNFYDPYTGLPMLVNLKKGVMYSVGHDVKDQDADPQFDVVAAIPVNPSISAGSKPSSGSSKGK